MMDPSVLQPIKIFQLLEKVTSQDTRCISLKDSTLKELFPNRMMASKNFAQVGWDFTDTKIRLDNPEVMVLFFGKDGQGSETLFSLFLTLAEAETLRWAMQENPEAFKESAATLLLCRHLTPSRRISERDDLEWHRISYDWSTLLLSKNLLQDRINQKQHELAALAQILCLSKVFDSYLYFNLTELALLLKALSAASSHNASDHGAVSQEYIQMVLEERQSFFKCLVTSRRRCQNTYQGTPFSEIMSFFDASDMQRKERNAEKIRKAFQQNYKHISIETLQSSYCLFDTNSDGTLDHEELMSVMKNVYSKINLAEARDLDVMMKDTISVLDKNDTKAVSFRQFASFFFEGQGIDSSQKPKTAKARKKPMRIKLTRKQGSTSSKPQPADTNIPDRAPAADNMNLHMAPGPEATHVPSHILFQELSLIGQLVPAARREDNVKKNRR